MKIQDVMGSGAPEEAMQQEPVPMAQGAAQQGPVQQAPPGQQAGGDQATPEEQEAYERVVLAASEVLYEPKTSKPILESLKASADDPAQAIGQVAVMIIQQLDDKSNGTIPEVVIAQAAAEIAEMVAELGHSKGLFEVDEAVINRAGQVMLMGLAEAYDIDPEEIRALMESMDPAEVEQMRAQQDSYANAGAPTNEQG